MKVCLNCRLVLRFFLFLFCILQLRPHLFDHPSDLIVPERILRYDVRRFVLRWVVGHAINLDARVEEGRVLLQNCERLA